jgi:hypothetical protein
MIKWISQEGTIHRQIPLYQVLDKVLITYQFQTFLKQANYHQKLQLYKYLLENLVLCYSNLGKVILVIKNKRVTLVIKNKKVLVYKEVN